IHKAQIAIENWSGGITPHVRLPAQIAMPQFTSTQVITIHARRPKPRHDALPVRYRRRRTRRVIWRRLFPLLRSFARWAGGPKQLSTAPIQAHHRAPVLDRLRDENPFLPNNRR